MKKHNKNQNYHSLRSFGRANSARPFGGRYIHMLLKPLALIFFTLSSTYVLAIESQPLEGSFFVSPQGYIDPSPEEKNTHYRILLKGQSAKELYDLMESEIKIDRCTEAKSKTVGAMQCFHFENKRGYECNFSIDVENQKIEFGRAC